MLTMDPKAELMRIVPGLATYRDADLARLVPLVDEVSFAPGTTLVREGTHGKQVFVLVDGLADVTFEGRARATVGPGDYVGEVAALDHGLHTATVVARTVVRALVMDPRSFVTILSEPRVATRLAVQLAQRLRGTA
jgi:CRP/FNR family cyclic AMP-dependent transcriptional regulator